MTLASMSGPEPDQSAASGPAADRSVALFADARAMHDAALARWDAGDIRDAAEKAWCATKRAADGLIVARTGHAPQESLDTTRGLRHLSSADEDVHRSMGHYYAAREALHGHCFYYGFCEPVDGTERLIRETIDYIAEAEALAAPPTAVTPD